MSGRAIPRRQRQVWEALASSLNVKQTAGYLGISPKTVEFHLAELKRRLRLFDVAALTREAVRTGLIKL